MLELLVVFQTVVLIVLAILIAKLYLTIEGLKRRIQGPATKQPPQAEATRTAPAQAEPTRTMSTQTAPAQAKTTQAEAPAVVPIPVPALSLQGPPPPQMGHAQVDAHRTQRQPQQGPRQQQRAQEQRQQKQQRQTPRQPREHASLENVLGTRVLGILAALLVFAGLVFLAILMVPALSDEVRCAAMFVLSGALALAGELVTERKKTPFSLALLGCGLGSVFVSLIVTYVYFGFLSDLPTMALLLVWLGACTFLAKRHESVALVVVEQVGMAVSVCFAYSQGIERGQLPVVVAYQLMACAIVAVGCIFSLERGRLAGIFASMGVSLIASNLIAAAYTWGPSHIDAVSFTATMGTQLIVVSVLQALAWILKRLEHEGDEQKGNTKSSSDTAVHIGGEILWYAAVLLDVCTTALLVGDTSFGDSVQIAALASVACVVVHWIVIALLDRSHVLQKGPSHASVFVCAVASTLLLAWRFFAYTHAVLPFVILVAAALWLSGMVLDERKHEKHAIAFLTTDAVLMGIHGYEALNDFIGVPLAILYLVALIALAFVWWRMLPENEREHAISPMVVCVLILAELSLKPVWSASMLSRELSSLAAYCSALVLVGVLAFVELPHRVALNKGTETVLDVNELLVVASTCTVVVAKGPQGYASVSPVAPVLALGATFVAGGIVAYRLFGISQHASDTRQWEQVIAGIMLTLWTTCFAWGLVPATMETIVTVVAMLSALVCIVLGFARRLSALRLYGLVCVLLCVLKIVLVDVHASDSIGRVIAFIVGGVICFAISAIYTYAVRRIEKQ